MERTPDTNEAPADPMPAAELGVSPATPDMAGTNETPALSTPAAELGESPPAPTEVEPPSLKLLYELALKKMEVLDRTFDAHNGRAAALFGFASFIVTNALAASDKVMARAKNCTIVNHEYGFLAKPLSEILVVLLFAIFAVMVCFCYQAYRIKSDPALPKLEVHYEKRGHLEEWRMRMQLFAEITAACTKKSRLIDDKAKSIQRALWCLMIEIGLLLLALGIPYFC